MNGTHRCSAPSSARHSHRRVGAVPIDRRRAVHRSTGLRRDAVHDHGGAPMTWCRPSSIAGPGTNRDRDVVDALELAGAARRDRVGVGARRPACVLDGLGLAVVAGGFSYADSLGAGRMLALDLAVGVGDELRAFVAAGRPVIGICNGFQVLTSAGILPGALGHNVGGPFDCRWVELDRCRTRCASGRPASTSRSTARSLTARVGSSIPIRTHSPRRGRSRCGTRPRTRTDPWRTSPGCVIRPASCSVSCPTPRTTSSPANTPSPPWCRAGDDRHSGLHLFTNGVRHAQGV